MIKLSENINPLFAVGILLAFIITNQNGVENDADQRIYFLK